MGWKDGVSAPGIWACVRWARTARDLTALGRIPSPAPATLQMTSTVSKGAATDGARLMHRGWSTAPDPCLTSNQPDQQPVTAVGTPSNPPVGAALRNAILYF